MERSLLCAFILIKKDKSLESKEINKTFIFFMNGGVNTIKDLCK